MLAPDDECYPNHSWMPRKTWRGILLPAMCRLCGDEKVGDDRD